MHLGDPFFFQNIVEYSLKKWEPRVLLFWYMKLHLQNESNIGRFLNVTINYIVIDFTNFQTFVITWPVTVLTNFIVIFCMFNVIQHALSESVDPSYYIFMKFEHNINWAVYNNPLFWIVLYQIRIVYIKTNWGFTH